MMITDYEMVQEKFPQIYAQTGRDQCCSNHFHKKIELIYILRGEKTVHINDKIYRLGPDNMALADSYSPHRYQPAPESEQTVIVLPVQYCNNYFSYRKTNQLCDSVVDDREYCREHLLPFLGRILKHEELDEFSLQANIDMLLANFCSRVGLKEQRPSPLLENIDAILQYVETNYAQELTLDSLASHFGYSKYYFSRMFNKLFHTNLSDYLALIRLQKTLQYFTQHKCSATTAALSNGFCSMPTFYRVLKKYYPDLSLKQFSG